MSLTPDAHHWSGMVAEPTITRNPDGAITLNWPDDAPDVALIARELMTQWMAGRQWLRELLLDFPTLLGDYQRELVGTIPDDVLALLGIDRSGVEDEPDEDDDDDQGDATA